MWAVPTFHGVHTLHAKICYDVSCDMDAVERIFTDSLSATIVWNPLYFHDLPIEANNS